jgi:hypothetical protein
MDNMKGKKAHKFSGKLKLESALQRLGDATVTVRLFDEAGMLNSLHEADASALIVVTHGGRPADRLYTALRREVLLVKECGGAATLDTETETHVWTSAAGW